MTAFEDIIKLRNRGYTQEEIAQKTGISLRTIQRYLKLGKIPVYTRSKPSKEDPFEEFKTQAQELIKLKINGRIPRCSYIYNELKRQGYIGSLRTVQRKTYEQRAYLKEKEIYFEQYVPEGEMIEGDFTEIWIPFKNGEQKKYLWVMTLKASKGSFAYSFPNQTFEAFAEGSARGFEYFGGVARIYRLDNLKPVVKKILRNGRGLTKKFEQLQAYYQVKGDFCNPGKGNEKGTVEATNKHFKEYLLWEIAVKDKVFETDDEFDLFLSITLEDYNRPKQIEIDQEKKSLRALPINPFPYFSTEVGKVNKYGFVYAAGRRYSVASEHKFKQVEIRLTSRYVEIFYQGEKIKEHKRETASKVAPSIDFLDHLDSMLRKPGAFTYYKHKEAFFPTAVFKIFYDKFPDNRNFLQCLSLCKKYPLLEVEAAIVLCMEANKPVNYENLISLIQLNSSNLQSPKIELHPLNPQLQVYDALLSHSHKGVSL